MKCLCGTKVFNLTLFTRLLNLCTTHHNIATLISVVIKPVSVLAIWYKLRPFLLLLEITHPCRGQIFATVSIIFAANPLWASASRDHRLRYWPLYYIRFCIRKTLTFVNNYLSAEDDFSVYPIRFYHSLRILVLIRFLSGVTCQGSVDFICFFFSWRITIAMCVRHEVPLFMILSVLVRTPKCLCMALEWLGQ